MASRKRPRANASVPETPTLPADLVLEIVMRSEPRALFRCAATSKLLCRDILSPFFIRRVSRQVPSSILIYLPTFVSEPLTLLHPAATSDTASFCDDHLFPFLLRRGADLFDHYTVVTSRRGLVLLRRLVIKDRSKSDSCFDLCVYDPMSGARTFLSEPAGIQSSEIQQPQEYVLLTVADGIDCSFLLLVVYHHAWCIKLQATSWRGTWGPVMDVCGRDVPWWLPKNRCNPAVLHGGVVHWLDEYRREKIISYDVGTGKTGSVKLPPTNCGINQLHLVTSSDGKVLKLLAIERFMMSVWLQLPVSAAGGSDWSLEAVIDTEEKLRSLYPDIDDYGRDEPIEFKGSGKRSGEVVILEGAAWDNEATTSDLLQAVVVATPSSLEMLEPGWGSRG